MEIEEIERSKEPHLWHRIQPSVIKEKNGEVWERPGTKRTSVLGDARGGQKGVNERETECVQSERRNQDHSRRPSEGLGRTNSAEVPTSGECGTINRREVRVD